MTTIPKQHIDTSLIHLVTQLSAESGHPIQRDIKLDDSLSYLGFDSLSRAELLRRIEAEYDITISDKAFMQADTLNELAQCIRDAKPGRIQKQASTFSVAQKEASSVSPAQAKTLLDALLMYGEKSPEKTHVYFTDEDNKQTLITYGTLLQSSQRVASSLRELGLKEGETVAIMQPTHPAFFYTFFGTLLAGGVPVPIYPPFRMHMLESYAKTEAKILSSAEVRILVTFERAELLSRLLKSFVPSLTHVVTAHELLEGKQLLTSPFPAKANGLAFIQYTSGSTNDPKGVMLTHDNLLSNIRAYGQAIAVTPDDITVSWLPLYHDMGLIGMWLGSLYYGIPLVLLTPFSFLNSPEKWLWAIHHHRGTLSGAPNFAYELCANRLDVALLEGLDLSSWRMAANGAEKIYPRTLQQFAAKFKPYHFKSEALLPVYGLAESTVGLAIPPVNRGYVIDTVDRKSFEKERRALPSTDKGALSFVCCGHAIKGHEIRIVDDENHILPPRHVGNLQFRGPSNMQGYYNNPAATQAAIVEGWIDSGDLAYLADDEVYITGRRKDLIIKAGRNLYPVEIEELAGNVPGIRLGCVAAFEITDAAHATERLVVVAETREKDKKEQAAIKEAVKASIIAALDIAPDEIVLVKPHTVPKTSSGKLQRNACKQLYMKGKLGGRHTPPWLQVVKLSVKSAWRKSMNGLKLAASYLFTLYMVAVILISLIPIYLVVRFGSSDLAMRVCKQWARFLIACAWTPLKVVNKEKLQHQQAVIYTANHSSYLDAIIALAIIPPKTKMVGKKELLSTPIIRTFVKRLNFLVVDRLDLSKGVEDTKEIESALTSGWSIFIFPEGTFSYSSGLRPFRMGAFKMACETKSAIVPIAIRGSRLIWRGDEKHIQPGHITVIVNDAIAPEGNEWHDVVKLRDAVRSVIAEHCGEQSLDFIAAEKIAPKHHGQ